MKKQNKRKKRRRLKLGTFAGTFFMLSMLAYLTSALFLRSYNNSLSTQMQEISAQIATIQTENDAVAVDVDTLNTRERVTGIAEDDGLSSDYENVVTITKADSDASSTDSSTSGD